MKKSGKKATIICVVLVLVLLYFLEDISQASGDVSSYEPLRRKISFIVSEYAGKMKIGVSFIDINEEFSFHVHGSETFPLASVFKVPIMIAVMKKVDKGEIKLMDSIMIRERDKCIGSGILLDLPSGSGVSVQKCIELMITISDNTAADILWNIIGYDAVNDMMRELKLSHSNIYIPNRPGYLISLGLGNEFKGKDPSEIAALWKAKSMKERRNSIMAVLEECKDLSIQEFQAIENESASMQTGEAYYADSVVAEALDNYSSPNDMAKLLRKLYGGELLSKGSTEYCLGVLSRQKYNSRIPRLLPRDLVIYHKTGTVCGIVNDMGIIMISRRCPVVLVVFVKNIAAGGSQQASNAIARISRCIYDYYCKRI